MISTFVIILALLVSVSTIISLVWMRKNMNNIINNRSSEIERMLQIEKEREVLQAQERERETKLYQQQIDLLNQQLSRQSEEMKRQAEDFRRQTEESRKQARIEFENLSLEALNMQKEALSNQKKELQEENSRQITELLNPLRNRLEDFNKTVTDSYVKENASRQSLHDQIDRLMKLNSTIGEDAKNLTKALKGDSKVQGNWGETILERLLEQAGMQRDINYSVQLGSDQFGKALRDESGALRRPDIIIYLPEGRNIIIDSKVSLTSYIEFIQAENEKERTTATKRLLDSVKKHVLELADKQYQKIIKNSAEQVLMFMPNEGAWMTAVHADPGLWDYAFRRNVVIVCPTHLFSVLQLISQMWRTDKQNRNAAEIAKLGGLIYDKMANFTKEFENIRKYIHNTEAAFDGCLKHLTSGGTSIMARTQRMKQLGVKTTASLSPLIEESLEENDK